MDFFSYFTDPILRAPTIGSILMCAAASLAGVILFLRKQLLISESTSHAAYPGAVLAVFLLSLFGPDYEEFSFFAVLGGALLSAFLGLKSIQWVEKFGRANKDAALCLVLSLFFGIGIFFASALQQMQPLWVQQIHILLFGQAATLTDGHIAMYACLLAISIAFIAFTFRPLQALLFDRNFAASIGIGVRIVEQIFLWILLISIVAGIRSVGVVLVSGMLIAPAIAARQFSHRLGAVFFLAGLFGALSGLIGSILSVQWQVPTGPIIVLVGASFALLGMLVSPKRGVLCRLARRASFQLRCLEENVLKGLWKRGEMHRDALRQNYPAFSRIVLFRLLRQGWASNRKNIFCLTEDGAAKAASIVRLHRLWELYLTEHLGSSPERVHLSAEEMEHVLTPEIEQSLTHLLSDPQKDPHQQPIPERRGF